MYNVCISVSNDPVHFGRISDSLMSKTCSFDESASCLHFGYRADIAGTSLPTEIFDNFGQNSTVRLRRVLLAR